MSLIFLPFIVIAEFKLFMDLYSQHVVREQCYLQFWSVKAAVSDGRDLEAAALEMHSYALWVIIGSVG